MPNWVLIAAVLILYGFWAVAMRIVGSHMSLPWAAVIGLCVALPIDAILIAHVSGPPPAPKYIIWAVALVAASIAASFIYLHAAKYYSGPVLTSSTALYPLVALPVFIAMGDKVTPRQILGCVMAAAGAWLITWHA